ncbi:2-keto-3-deoxy-6-phosphogluconate aldolase [Myroides gitamensis]|nr:2-keto-3-deoxy-6-phosphogluconate aldolase [Myroides gitamensis]
MVQQRLLLINLLKNEDIAKLKQQLSIPIISSVSTLNFDFDQRIQSGVSCFNVTGGSNTVAIVEHLQRNYPDFPIISTGGKTFDSLHSIVNKKISAVILTPPSNAELFRSIMDTYRLE